MAAPRSYTAEGSTGLLFPTVPAMITVADGSPARVIHAGAGWVSTIDGELRADVVELIESGKPTRRLRSLAAVHPVAGHLVDWADRAVVALTPSSAVELDGFGTLFIELVGRCNERCVHCYASSGPDVGGHLERDVCESVIDDASELGVQRIQLTGGDPLLCRFLPELVDRASASAVQVVEIYTNGLLLDDGLIERLQPSHPAFAFSFYSSDQDAHDAITRTPGSQRRTAAAIRRAVVAGFDVRVSIVVMPQNAHTVDDTVAFLQDAGVGFVGVAGSFEAGRGQHYEGAVRAGASDTHRQTAGGGRISASGKLCVTYDGAVVPCIFNRDLVLGRVGERRLADIVRDPAPVARRHLSHEHAVQSCRSQLQCSTCRLTSVALFSQGA